MFQAAGVISALLYLCSLSTAQVDLKTCGNEHSDITCSFFFRKVDEAFRQRADILYTLRKSFFPAIGARPILFDTSMTLEIENAPDISCSDEEYEFRDNRISNVPTMSEVCSMYPCGPYRLQWVHQWSKTIITFIIEREDLELLQDTNFVAYSAAIFNSFDTSVFSDEGENLQDNNSTNSTGLSLAGTDTVEFLLTINYLPCRPDDGVLLEAWEDILPWIELYSMNSDNLENVEYTQEGRGYAFRESGDRRRGLTVPLLTVIHILLNTVFALAATYFLHKYHSSLNQVKGKQYQLVASMYWSVVFMCLIGAVVIITGNCYLYYALIFIDDRSSDVVGFRIASDVTVGILALIELVASMLTPHDPAFFIPHVIRRTLCCNQCCYCCGSENRRNLLRRGILGVAMWIIILFLQLVISSLLPIAVTVITNPVPSLAFISIMIALFFCLVVFIAYFLNAFEGNYIARHRLSKEERRRSGNEFSSLIRDISLAGNWMREKLVLVAQAFVFIVIFVIVALVVILYLNIVRAGANTNTVGGLIFSLVPSVVLGGITWAAKKHLFKELEKEEEEEISEASEDTEDVQETVIQFGGLSFRPKTWRRPSRRKHKLLNGKKHTVIAAPNTFDKHGDSTENGPGHSDSVIEMDSVDKANDTARAADLEQEETDNNEGKNEVMEAEDEKEYKLTWEVSGDTQESLKRESTFAVDDNATL